MANVLTGRQLYLDTVGVVSLTGLKVANIIYADGTVAGNMAVLNDRLGRPVFRGVMSSDLEADTSTKIGWVDGLTLAQLDSGNVIVYLE